ncbi:phage tail protein [Fusobacterium nucleatum]|uniref:phage tail protein n=1 Tax=Fusobacterium nucleatum TaxID=851 RepID=UPI0030CADC7E
MAKTIGVLLSLKDQFTTPLQKATKSVKNMDRQLEKAGNQVKAFGRKIKNGMKKVAKWAAVGFGALTAGAVLFAKQSIDAAKDQVRIEKLLETTMKRTSNASKEQIQSIKDEASALQNVGVVGDEVALAGANQLAVYGLRSDQIKKLMPNLNDMIAKEKGLNGTQEDAVAMADVIGKAMNGKTKGLLKYGVSLTAAEEKLFKTMKQEQKMEFISKKLNESIGGTNKALRETDEGKIVAAKNAWGDMKEELGKKLLPIMGNVADWFSTKIPAIQNFILGIADKIQELVTRAEPYITQIKDMFGKIFEKVKPALEETWQILSDASAVAIDIAQDIINNWDRISPVVYTLVGAIAAYKLVMFGAWVYTTAMVAITKVKMAWDAAQAAATNGLTVAQWALNVAMNANPIGLIITAIAVLIGVGWMLYKNWDLIKKKVSELWDKLLNWLQPAIDTVKAAFEKIIETINKVKEAFQKVKEKISGAIDKLKFWNKTEAKDKEINITENTKKTTETIGGANKTGVTPTTVKNPRHALGTAYFKGGVTGINEGGRDETAILPAGTKILSHEEGKTIQKNNTNKKIEVIINIDGNFIGEKEHMEKYGEYTANKILAALNNM